MAEEISIRCWEDIRNYFTRAQYNLDQEFQVLDGRMGIWDGKIRNLGAFPLASGWASRATTLGFQRPRLSSIQFNPLVGLQEDCLTSCNTPSNRVNLGAAQHIWYRMTEYSENTEVFCLKSMWGDALNLREQLENHVRNLRERTATIMDYYKRSNYNAIASNKWIAAEGISAPRRGYWRFAADANGQADVRYIILDGVEPENIALPSIPILNYIIDQGTYWNAFPLNGGAEFITDWETIQELPKFDTNTRADNRFRAPDSLDPAYPSVTSYAGIRFTRDPFALRYYWTEDEPDYPNGVLKLIEPWTDKPVSEACFDEVNTDYLEADFQLSPFYNDNVFGLQTLNLPTNLPGGTYEQPQSPYNGMWRFINENDPVTPCNTDRNLAYWRMIVDLAAKPIRAGFLGHTVLHRRFGTRGIVKSCRPLQVPVGGTYDCDESCAPFDWTPPALVVRETCSGWNPDAITGCATQN